MGRRGSGAAAVSGAFGIHLGFRDRPLVDASILYPLSYTSTLLSIPYPLPTPYPNMAFFRFETMVLAVVWASLLGGVGQAQQDPPAPRRAPNLLVVLVDDLGYGDLACQGAADLSTPQIDALFADGLTMTNFYANCPVCSPTRASLLTGRYPELVGVPGVIRTHAENSWGYLDPHAVLLPQLLQGAGYDTAIVGKWHLGLAAPNTPNERGFDFFHGFLGDMMDDYFSHRRHGENYMRLDDARIDPQGHATDLFTEWACDYLRRHSQARDVAEASTRPFFLYLAYNAPHTPIQPPADWLANVQKRRPQLDPRRAKLAALIEHLDDGVGRVLRCLRECDLERDTVVVFTSDNGGQVDVGANNGRHRDGKQSMYEGGLRVPFCVRWPGRVRAGATDPTVALTMDLFPTLCELAGAEVLRPIDGVSLAAAWRGDPAAAPQRDVFFHRREGGDRYGGLTIQAVRRGPWKLLQNSPFAPLELYHLERDPLEQEDLASKERAVFRDLSAALRRQIQRGGAVPWQADATLWK